MRVLVTGGAGFIGSHVADKMIAQGHEVTIVDNLSTGRPRNIPGRAEFHELDIRDEALGDVFASFNPEIVSHLSLIHISEPTRRTPISYAVFCLKKKKKRKKKKK